MQYTMSQLKKLQEVAAMEARLIDLRGYATRVFKEDNSNKGSWGYTVGLTSPSLYDRDNICLFVRAGIEENLIEEILCEVSEFALKNELPVNQAFTAGDFKIEGTKEPLRLKIKRIGHEWLDKLTSEYDSPIEGQKPDTGYFWIWIADPGNRLPGEDGYEDFCQTEVPDHSVEDIHNLSMFDDVD